MNKIAIPSAQADSFVHDHLPPPEQWPELRFDLPELQLPAQVNAVQALFERAIKAGHADRALFRSDERTLSYAQAQAEVNRMANVFTVELGLVPGNRVLLRAANNPMLVACWCAVLKAGGICVTTMQLLRARELVYIVEKAEIRHALCDISLAEAMEETCSRKPELTETLYFTATGDGHASLDKAITDKSGGFENCGAPLLVCMYHSSFCAPSRARVSLSPT